MTAVAENQTRCVSAPGVREAEEGAGFHASVTKEQRSLGLEVDHPRCARMDPVRPTSGNPNRSWSSFTQISYSDSCHL